MERKARMIIQPIDSPAGAAMSPSARSSILPHLALMLSMLVWSSTFIGLKIALSAYSPASAMALRMGSAALLCLPLLPRLLRAMKHPAVRRVLLFGVLCEPCLYFLCETSALRHTSSAQAGMVLALLPLTAAAGARLFLGENMEGRAWLGFALALFGVIWISCGGEVSESSPSPLLGNALEALAVLCATGYTLCMRKLSAVLPPLLLTAAMTFAGTLFFSALSLLPFSAEPVRLAVTVPDWMPAAAILYLGIAATFGGYGLYNYGIARLSAGRAAAYTNLIPVITLFMGVFCLNEHMTPAQYLASVLVVAGVMLSQSGRALREEHAHA